ncbi:FecR family protein [Oceanibaculum pacificum]|nr:FecR domain-containing protein [Oceanibaculum pacificum]
MDDRRQPSSASEWLVALLDQPDDRKLRADFARWIAASAAHARDWEEIAQTYEAMGEVAPLHRAYWADREAVSRPLPTVAPRRKAGRRVGLGLAGVAMAACLTLALLPDMILRWTADYATETAERQTVRLEDGSIVRLGPDSALEIVYTEAERRVRLLEGQAFFEVAANLERPFRVTANAVEATVIGTAFEVRMAHRATRVAVREGSVRVSRDGVVPPVNETLSAGDWARLSWDGGDDGRGHMPAQNVASWLDGQLVVQDLPVAEVVAELRHYYSGIVLVQGDALAGRPLTGVYNLSDPVAAFRAIASAQGASFHQLSPWVVLISGG